MKLQIPVAFGLEAVAKRQLKNLGYDRAPATNGRIAVEGDWRDVARLNVFLRSGERVLIELLSFSCRTFDELYDGVFAFPWEDWLPVDAKILMDGKSQKSALAAVKASGGVIKKAIATRLCEKYGVHELSETGSRYTVGFSIYEDEVTLTLDTTGESLHKRGYRTKPYEAPLKETLAAGLIDLTYYSPEKVFSDPMCGSGTLCIEAAMKSLNIAPGRSRDFDFCRWNIAQKGVLEEAREEARALETPDKKIEVLGSDINPDAVEIARFHAHRAGVERHIRFSVADAKDFESEATRGVMVCNPPYGERMEGDETVKGLYRDFGKMCARLPDWNVYVLCGSRFFERNFGRRPDKKKTLYNANIECTFYSYLSSKPERGEK